MLLPSQCNCVICVNLIIRGKYSARLKQFPRYFIRTDRQTDRQT
jgi:hypothetical protein